MRLINAITLTMHTFGGRPPPYAILSHTWGQEEVSFQDFQLGPEHFGRLRGYAKIEGCCRQARKDGYEWVWVDTCCIDKSSSAELSEAINSMYKWYQGSDVCYVYLADMPRLSPKEMVKFMAAEGNIHANNNGNGGGFGSGKTKRFNSRYNTWNEKKKFDGDSSSSDGDEDDTDASIFEDDETDVDFYGGGGYGGPVISDDVEENHPPSRWFMRKWNTEQRNFLTCPWFTRGWTLQELIAPRHVDFYAEDWSRIGTRLSLAKPIHYRTGIPVEVLRGKPPSACLACQKMSWAAHRETSRKEDMAYCLMGIFEVHMPLLYGEGGDEAFRRLQEEILKRSEDLSLLAWSSAHSPNDDPEVEMQRSSKNSFLAASPADFSEIRTWGAPEVIRSKFHIHQKQLQWRDVHAFSRQYESEYRSQEVLEVARARQFELEPPVVTSRGLLATFLVDRAPNKETFIAWIFTAAIVDDGDSNNNKNRNNSESEETKSRLSYNVAGICVAYRPAPPLCVQTRASANSEDDPTVGAAITVMRIDADHLYCVPLDELLTKFVPRRLYLEINNSPGGSTSRARRSDPASWFSTVPFRIHVRSPDSEPGRQHPHTLSLARVIPREESVSPDASRWLGDPLVDNIFRVSIMINFDPRNLDNPFTRNFENPIAIFSYRVDACQRKKEPSWLAVIIGYCQGGTQLYCRVEEFTLQNKTPERERIGRRDSGISSVGSIGSSSSELEEDLEDKYEDLLNWDCRKPLGNFADMDYIELECGHVVGVTARRGNFEETGCECPHHGARCCATFHPVLEITFS